jgi:hypothetical protein
MATVIIGSVSVTGQDPPSAQGTFALKRRYLLCCDVLRHIRGRYPSFIAHTGPCARPSSSCCLRSSLLQQVFAGCRQSLLENGPSRHYLCNPYVGAWTPTPQCPSGAFARFFPEDSGLTSDVTGSAHRNLPIMQLQLGIHFRGCSHSFMFRLPRSLDLQVAPTAEALCLQGSQAVYTTHSPVGYLPRDVASLRIRHEQLIRLDFHQLDCSLVGRSDVHENMTCVNLL